MPGMPPRKTDGSSWYAVHATRPERLIMFLTQIKITKDVKDKNLSFYNPKTNKLFAVLEKKLSKPKIQKDLKDDLIKITRNLSKLKKKKNQRMLQWNS